MPFQLNDSTWKNIYGVPSVCISIHNIVSTSLSIYFMQSTMEDISLICAIHFQGQ